MTLTGDLALDWVKGGVENVVKVSKIEFGSARAYSNQYNIPEYHIDKAVVALLYPVDQWSNPVLVTQQSILKPLEAKCAEWEAAGATANTVKIDGATVGRLTFSEDEPTITMFKHKKAAQFAPYEVKFE